MSLLRNNDDKWVVNSSCVNLPAALNDPAKGIILKLTSSIKGACPSNPIIVFMLIE